MEMSTAVPTTSPANTTDLLIPTTAGPSSEPACELPDAARSKRGNALSTAAPTKRKRAVRQTEVAGVAMPDANGAPTLERPSRERKVTARMQQEME